MTLPDATTAPAPRGPAPSVVRHRLLGAAVIAAVPGVVLTWCVLAGRAWPQGSDDAFRRWVLSWSSGLPRLIDVSDALRVVGGGLVVTLVAVAVTLGLAVARRWREAAFVAVCALGGAVLNAVLKSWVERPRGTDPPALAFEPSTSFPSGHAMAAVYVYGALGVLAWRAGGRGWRVAAVLLWLLAAAISASRVLLGVHYVSDVVAAWSYATAWVLAVAAVVLVPGRAAVEGGTATPRPVLAGPGSA